MKRNCEQSNEDMIDSHEQQTQAKAIAPKH